MSDEPINAGRIDLDDPVNRHIASQAGHVPLPSDEAKAAAIRHRLTSDGCCPYCSPHGTIEEGPPGATWTVPCDHGGVRQQAERYLKAAYAIDVPRIRAEERAATLREVEAWEEKAEANVAIQLALSERLNERDQAINDALRSLDNLKGHRCREQAVFLAHVDSIQQTLIAAAHFNPEAE